MMRENLKTKCCEYIAVYVDDLYIASQKPKHIVNTLKTKHKIKIKTDEKLSYHLELITPMIQVGQWFVN